MAASSVRPKAVYTGRPLPSRGSSGVSSPRSPVLSVDSDCSASIPPHFIAFAWRYLASYRLRVHPSGTPRVIGPRPFLLRGPHRISRKERISPPRFLGNPFVCMPCSLTPVDTQTRPHSVHTLSPSALSKASAPHCGFRGSITRPAHPLCTLRSGGRPRTTQHSVPVAGQPYRFGTCTRRVAMKGFQSFRSSILLSQALPGAPKAPHAAAQAPCGGRQWTAPISKRWGSVASRNAG